METLKLFIGAIMALATLGLIITFMVACAILPVLAVIWLCQLIF